MGGAAKDEPLPDFGFQRSDPDYLDMVAELAHVLSTYHVLPEAGGWLDQDAALTDDILTFEYLKDRLSDDEEDEKDAYDETGQSMHGDFDERELM